MKTLRPITYLMAVPLAWSMPFSGAQSAPEYILTDLGVLSGTFSHAQSINANGDVAGFATATDDALLRPFLWREAAGMTDLLGADTAHGQAFDVNGSGQVTGLSHTLSPVGVRGFVWRAGTLTALPTFGGAFSRGMAINDNGLVTGAASVTGDTAEHAFYWQDNPAPTADTMRDLGTLGGVRSQGNDIDLTGRVAGYAELANRDSHATLWTPPFTAAPRDLGTLGGRYSEAFALNAAGQVVGYASLLGDTQHHAFLWQATQTPAMRDLGTFPGGTFSEAYGINATGDVVGYSTNSADVDRRAFVRKTAATALADLNGLILTTTGWVLQEAQGINDRGQIVGVGTVGLQRHAFLLTPDKVAPVISCPSAITTAGTQPASIGQAIATDNLDPNPVISDNRPATFPVGATTVVTWKATDAAGNVATCTQSITVNANDTTPPVVSFTLSPAAPNGLNGWYNSAVTLAWTIVENESTITSRTGCLNATVSTNNAAFSASCAATSAGGTSPTSTAAFKLDVTAPAITAPTVAPQEATSATGNVVTWLAPAVVESTSGLNATGVVCTPASGSTFPLGTTPVSCTAADLAGNRGTSTFSVTVRDTTPPALTLPANLTVAAAGPAGVAVTYTATATDRVSGSRPVACLPLSGSTFPLGTTLVSCSSSDAAGNVANGSFSVSVADRTAPVLSLPANISVSTSNSAGTAVTYTATATDAVAGAVPVTCTPASGSTFPVTTTTVNCSASDPAGNVRTGSFLVTVSLTAPPPPADTIAPTITCPANVSVTQGQAISLGTPVVSDNVTPAAQILVSNNAPASFPVGTTSVRWTATDAAGLSSACTQTVTVAAAPVPTTTDIAASTTTSNNGPKVNEAYRYTFTVRNNGSQVAQTVGFNTALAATLRLGTVSTSIGTCSVPAAGTLGATVTCSLGNIAANSSAQVVVNVTPTVIGTITTRGTFTTFSNDTNTGNNSAAVNVTVR